jgi:hypothetical protein
MAALLALPNEVILYIYTKCPTLHSVASLSATNKQLYSVWHENTNHIAKAILRPQVPNY